MRHRPALSAALAAIVLTSLPMAATRTDHGEALAGWLLARLRGGYTVAERLDALAPRAEARLRPAFAAAGLAYPPAELAYLAFKDTRRLEVWARAKPDDPWRHVTTYAVQGLGGVAGPKLAEGDGQVPEGIYRAALLNPNSRYHVSIRLDYPNEFDRRQAALDGRTRLGGDIMIHGTDSSIGCLAVGNAAAEDLFVLAGRVSEDDLRIVVAPTDFRVRAAPAPARGPAWLASLYDGIGHELAAYRQSPDAAAGR